MIEDRRRTVLFWRCLICGEWLGDLRFEVNRWQSRQRLAYQRRQETAEAVFR